MPITSGNSEYIIKITFSPRPIVTHFFLLLLSNGQRISRLLKRKFILGPFAIVQCLNMDKQLTIDLDKCNGCRMCEMACSLEKEGECSTRYSRIRVIKINESLDVPIVCLQCEDPVCEKVCPVKAITRSDIGALWINNDLCNGCKICVKVCPFGAVFFNPRLKKIIKCDLCNGDPSCVKFCQPKAIEYVRKNQWDPTAKGIAVKKMMKSAKTRKNYEQDVRSR